ncbi:unnamed protein product, partial [Meganyctiphanes norvegica]
YPFRNMLRVLLLLALVAIVRPQCLSEDDTKFPDPSSDLTGITEFGLDLFKELFDHTTPSNFFFSPYSVWNALILAYFGSQGTTETQLARALYVPDKVSTLNNWRKLEFLYEMRGLNNSDYTFNLANRAYFDNSVQLKSCMESILFNEIEKLDFTDTIGSAKTINGFVKNVTKDRIKELVSADDLQNAKMVLTNAAFFKGTWFSQFKPSATGKKLFYMTREEYTFVDMMVQKGNFRHGVSEELGAHILELPYTGDAMSMFILLPPFISGAQGFNAMVQSLNSSTLRDAMDNMWRVQVQVELPKFKMEQMIGDRLMNGLSNMGISDLFDANLANLSGFSSDGGLAVGGSIHKAFVEVNEEGTEAAAATAFISFRSSRPDSPATFACNHPFIFFIHDNLTKNILFIGAYKNPKN